MALCLAAIFSVSLLCSSLKSVELGRNEHDLWLAFNSLDFVKSRSLKSTEIADMKILLGCLFLAIVGLSTDSLAVTIFEDRGYA